MGLGIRVWGGIRVRVEVRPCLSEDRRTATQGSTKNIVAQIRHDFHAIRQRHAISDARDFSLAVWKISKGDNSQMTLAIIFKFGVTLHPSKDYIHSKNQASRMTSLSPEVRVVQQALQVRLVFF